MVDEATLSKTLLESFTEVAWVFFFTVLIAGAVLAVDFVALLLLNLHMNVGVWIILLFVEGLVMMLFGAAVWGEGEHIFYTAGWRRPHIYHVRLRPQISGFWVSVAMAGVVLFILCVYLNSQRY